MKNSNLFSTDELRTLSAITQLANYIAETIPDDPEIFLKQVEAAISITGVSHLEHVWPGMALWMLADEEHGLMRLCPQDQEILFVVEAFAEHLTGSYVSPSRWELAAKLSFASGVGWLGNDYELDWDELLHWKGTNNLTWCAGFAGFCLASSMMPFQAEEIKQEGDRGRYIKHALLFHSRPVGAANLAQKQRTKLFELSLGKELSG